MKDPDKVIERLETLGEEWAENNAAADLLEETKKSLLARLKNESAEKSEAGKERDALANREYTAYIEQMVQTRKIANKAKVRYDSAKVWCGLYRTNSATERAQMELQ